MDTMLARQSIAGNNLTIAICFMSFGNTEDGSKCLTKLSAKLADMKRSFRAVDGVKIRRKRTCSNKAVTGPNSRKRVVSVTDDFERNHLQQAEIFDKNVKAIHEKTLSYEEASRMARKGKVYQNTMMSAADLERFQREARSQSASPDYRFKDVNDPARKRTRLDLDSVPYIDVKKLNGGKLKVRASKRKFCFLSFMRTLGKSRFFPPVRFDQHVN
jgi:hypothetical protein